MCFCYIFTHIPLSDSDKTRTCNLLLRRQMLYPLSYGTNLYTRPHSRVKVTGLLLSSDLSG